jgi:hypothetical protein
LRSVILAAGRDRRIEKLSLQLAAAAIDDTGPALRLMLKLGGDSGDNAMALVGCPDRRIDRLCITCCSPSQPSHHADVRRDLVYGSKAAVAAVP